MPVAPACFTCDNEIGSCGPNQRQVSFILEVQFPWWRYVRELPAARRRYKIDHCRRIK